MNLRDDAAFDGIQYQATFTPERHQWTELTIPFSEFIPIFRGSRVNHAAAWDRSSICSFGFLISSEQEGAFRFEIDWIDMYL